ncbi:hypothetical protein NLU13_6529 [Sarocladium strictum]|uniref:NACHT domain-containing protein n=1 Tax=Sarocladium strictum TaxID=5046 RepID=A0AA39GG29_SARSR|nr:hypothetical protein NLU13_6529 [Sarocladium strictum]
MSERSTDTRGSTERDMRNAGRVSYGVEQGVQANHGGKVTVGQISHNYGARPQAAISLRERLAFPEMASRESNIEDVYGGTGRWLLETEQYRQWAPVTRMKSKCNCMCIPNKKERQTPGLKHYILWIMGNAGSGKSSLMKMAVDHAKSTYRNAFILPHFFNARGTALEQSTEGMYRTLITWLLLEMPDEMENDLARSLGPAIPTKWAIPQLVRLLKAAVSRLSGKQVVFFVDALDECKKGEIMEMLKVFRELTQASYECGKHNVRVCFASRPYPHFGFDAAEFLDLATFPEHNNDIVKYIHDELRIGNSDMAKEIRHELQRKAVGIFMWVVLVVRILNEDYSQGNIHRLRSQLEEIPSGLHELFRFTLERYPEDRSVLLVCFQWLLFAQWVPLSPDQLWWAIQVALERSSQEQIAEDYEKLSQEDTKRWIVHISKGLVEVLSADEYGDTAIQFVHESVRDFIFKEEELQKLYGAHSRAEFEAGSHEKLRNSCLTELMARGPEVVPLVEQKGVPPQLYGQDLRGLGWRPTEGRGNSRFPFARYATFCVLRHAEQIQRLGRDQAAFLDSFMQQAGPYVLDVTYVTDSRGSPVYGDLISCLIASNCPVLILETQSQPLHAARQRNEPFGLIDNVSRVCPVPLFHGIRFHTGFVALMDLYLRLDQERRQPRLQRVLTKITSTWQDEESTYDMDTNNPLLSVACRSPLLAVFLLIVMAPAAALEPHLDRLDNLIHTSGRLSTFLQVLHLFIAHHIPSDAIDYRDPTILPWFSVQGDDEIDTLSLAGPPVSGDEVEEIAQICGEILHSLSHNTTDPSVS